MPAKSLGTLTLDLIAKIGGFTGPLDKAERESRRKMADIKKSAEAAGKGLAALAAGAAAGLTAVTINAANTAQEIARMAAVSNAGTTEFQKFAAGAESVGISQEKLADILKDVNDRVGDFITTGGGPMKDFFENVAPLVGVTADEFKNLSGPQALGLFVDTLQKAGANQQEVTFFMEAMASDSTALTPLLLDQGKAMKELGTQAEELGLILSEETIKAGQEFKKELGLLGQVAEGLGNQVAAELLPDLAELTKTLKDPETVQAAAAMAKGVASSFNTIIKGARETVKFIQWASETAAAFMNGIAADDVVRLNDELERLQEMRAGGALDKLVFFGRDGIVEYYDEQELDQEIGKIQAAIKSAMEAPGKVTLPPEPKTEGKGLGLGLGLPTTKEIEKAAIAVTGTTDAIQAQIAALQNQAATIGLTREQLVLLRLEQEGASVAQIEAAEAALATISGYEAAQDELRERADLLELVGEIERSTWSDSSRALDEYQKKVETLREALLGGDISQGRYDMAVAALDVQLEDAAAATVEATDEISAAWEGAAQNIQGTLADFLFDPFEDGLDGMVDAFLKTIRRMAADAAAAQITELLFGSAVGAKGAGGSAGSAGLLVEVGSWLAGLASFDGGGSTGKGARSGGLDGKGGFLAMMHPDETVLDHVALRREPMIDYPGLQGAAVAPANNITINYSGSADPREARKATAEIARGVSRVVSGSGRYS